MAKKYPVDLAKLQQHCSSDLTKFSHSFGAKNLNSTSLRFYGLVLCGLKWDTKQFSRLLQAKFYKSFMFFMYFSSKTYALFDCQDAFWFLRHKRKLFDNQIASVHKSSNYILITYHVYIHALKSHLA